MKVKRNSKQSLTAQITGKLRTQIASGRLAKGTTLLSERELAAETGVARNCVRNAYAQLEKEGLLKSKYRGSRVVV